MPSLSLEERIQQASSQTRQQIQHLLDAPLPQQQEVAEILAEIKRQTPRGKFLAKLIHVGLIASEPVTRWPQFGEETDLGVIIAILTQPTVLERAPDLDPLAVHRLKGMQVKQQLLNYQGQPPLTSEEVALRLDMSREAVNKRRRKKQLLAINLGKRGYRYPAWQFEEEKVLTGLPEVLQALEAVGEWTPLLFFCSGNEQFNGDTPLEHLKAGEINRVIAAACNYGKPNPL
jgi:biotin operon repressor